MERALILNASGHYAPTVPEQYRMIREAGFDGIFTFGDDERIGEFAREAKAQDLIYQSVHAPFLGTDALWEEDPDKAETVLDALMTSLNQCVRNEIPLLILHAYIGFDKHCPGMIGVERFGRLVRAAEGTGVRLAFENTEGLEYLECLLSAFSGEPHVGFCWDSGHEMCYNGSEDLLARFGGRLFGTHLNDNLGVRDREGHITWIDDLHLLPFDGIADWACIADRLARTGFEGPLTFELSTGSKPGRHDNDKYRQMAPELYLAEGYARACRFRRLLSDISR